MAELFSAATLVKVAGGKKGLLWPRLRVWPVMVGRESQRQVCEVSTGSRDERSCSAPCLLIWPGTPAHAMRPPMSGRVFLP